MPRFPYMGFPFPYYKNSPKIPQNFSIPTFNNQLNYNSLKPDYNCESNLQETNFKKQKNKSNNNTDDYLFDLFGIKLYTDDVLLVSLIYFLYSEGVKDESLFIVLILLLLS